MSDGEQLGLATIEAPAAAPARPLPMPETLRFQPLRAGILNVWQYDDQELRFHRGRLILRGDNGTGKSKALEVLLPFLLDADLSPRRLDPFQGDGRSMRWNLLEGGKYDSRVGYVWLEFGRRRAGEEDGWVFVTVGCGLRASHRTSGVEPWYFVTDRRIGEGLSLLTSGRQPLVREQLRRALGGEGGGDGGTVFQRAADYRQRVDELLYGLGGERFKALRHLLLQLRRPQLSEKLDPRKLSELLTHSLPPVDEDLVGRLSAVFERLAHEEKEIARLRQATAGVEAFLGVYRDYCRGVARSRAAEVRVSDSRYRKKARRLRDADGEAREIDQELAGLERRLREVAADIDRSRGEVRALEQSEAMKSARALATLETHVRALADQADRDQRDAAALERETGERAADQAAARERDQRQRRRLDEPVRRASDEAAAVGLEAVHQGAEEKLAADAEAHEQAARGTVHAAVRDRGAAVEKLRGLIGELRRGEERFRRCDGRRREADEQVRAADERRRIAAAAVDSERENLATALDDWAGGCTELRLEDDELRRLHDAVDRQDAGDRATLPAVLGELVENRRDRLVAERTALEARRDGFAGERHEVAEERRRVEAARELSPAPPPTRTAVRQDRPGSPFYLLCDFAAGVDEAARAGLEAALEAAGLLDAWVLPDGRLLAAETLDTVLVPRPLAYRGVRTLADFLVAADAGEEPAVAAEVVAGLLASVAVGEAGAEVEVAVDVDGSWRLGPLHGRWAKPAAEYFGAAAREAARQRRLAALTASVADFDARLAELDEAIHGLAGRQRQLLAEARAAPPVVELESCRHRAAAAAADLERRRAELGEAESTLAAARGRRDETRRVLERRAGELHLVAWVDDLGGYLERLYAYEVAFGELTQARLAAQSAAASAERARRLLEATRARHDEARRRAAVSRGSARTVAAELEALQATAGAAAREIVARHGRAQRRLEEREAELESARGAESQAARRQAAVAERRRLLAEELFELGQVRETAAERLSRLAEVGLLVLVLDGVEADGSETGEEAVVDEAEADAGTADAETGGAWSMTRALAVARAIEKRTADVDLSQEAANRRSRRMNQRFLELSGELGGELQPNLEPDGELQLFRVVHQQRGYDGPELLDLLRGELGEHERLLAVDERELLRSFLLGEVGDHLRGRLRQAHDLTDRINGLLAGCRTASGMTLRLSWRADDDADSRIRQVVRLLRRDPELLADDDRRDHALVPWREHLLEALDYRRWHRFRILRRMPGESSWNELTQKSHAASSGGEKAVALHLPLFAAASAHYESARPEAPRLILLDEAFAGIDPGMRGRCMGLLVDFDLDFMMTSYDEWGCYEELPGVATYQLYRDPSVGGVAAIRCVWNGERLIEEEAP